MQCRKVDIDFDPAAPNEQYFTACMRSCDNKISLRADSVNPTVPFDPWVNGLQVEIFTYSKLDTTYPPRLGVPIDIPNFVNNNQDVCIRCADDCSVYVFKVTSTGGVNPHLSIVICEDNCCPCDNPKGCGC